MSPNPAILTWPRPVGGGMALDYLASYWRANSLQTFAFPTVTLGSPAPTRRIHVAVSGSGIAAKDIASVTIGDISAIKDAGVRYPTPWVRTVSIWSATVPSGDTGLVVVAFDGTQERCNIGVYRSTGASATPLDTAISDNNPASLTINSTPGGYVIAASTARADSVPTWTGATGDYATQNEVAWTTASVASAAESTTIGLDWAYSYPATVAVAYQPA